MANGYVDAPHIACASLFGCTRGARASLFALGRRRTRSADGSLRGRARRQRQAWPLPRSQARSYAQRGHAPRTEPPNRAGGRYRPWAELLPPAQAARARTDSTAPKPRSRYVRAEVVGRYAAALHTVDLTSARDRALPIVPEFVWPYEASYLLALLSLVVIKECNRLNVSLVVVLIASRNLFTSPVVGFWLMRDHCVPMCRDAPGPKLRRPLGTRVHKILAYA